MKKGDFEKLDVLINDKEDIQKDCLNFLTNLS